MNEYIRGSIAEIELNGINNGVDPVLTRHNAVIALRIVLGYYEREVIKDSIKLELKNEPPPKLSPLR